MVIHEINITEFGGLKDLSLSLGEGMNLICGGNEAGKSTVMLFIKYMLYGMPRKSASNPERERYISREGKVAAGSMTFSAGGKKYAVERHFRGVRGSDSFKLICLDNGEVIDTDSQPGEYFFGVPREVFESSSAIGQMRVSEINGEKTVGAIENILVSADETVDTAGALSALDKIRTEYRHKNGAGGRLYHGEAEIAAQREKVKVATERAAALKEQKRRLAECEAELSRCEDEYGNADRIYEKARAVSLLKQFDKLREAESALENIENEEKDFAEREAGFSPTRGAAERLKAVMAEYGNAIREASCAEIAVRDAMDLGGDEKLAEEARRYSSIGGKANIISRARSFGAKASRMIALSVASFSLAGIFALAYVTLLMMSVNIPYILIAVPLLAAIGVMGLTGSKRNGKRFAEAIEGYESINAYEAHISFCEENLRLCEAKRAAVLKAGGRLEGAEKHVAEVAALMANELDAAGVIYEPDGLEAGVLRLISRIEAHCSRREDISARKKAMAETVKAIREPLAEYDEEALRESLGNDTDGIDEASMADAATKRKFYAMKLDALRRTILNLSTTVAQLEANFIEPLGLADRLSELERTQAEDREFYDALVLAMDSIKSAGEKLQNTVTPEISRRAGDMMSIVSGGRYDSVVMGKKLSPFLSEKNLPVSAELLSGGTRDILYTVLRISLMIQIFGEELPPVLMDESFCQLDDVRTEKMLSMLCGLSNTGMQILIFSCHSREKDMCGRLGIENNFISL